MADNKNPVEEAGMSGVKILIEKGGIKLKDTIPQEVVERWQHWLV